MLEESSRPPAPLGTQTSDVTLDSSLPCIACGHRNPESGHGKFSAETHGESEGKQRTSWWCHPTEPGETSQSSREPSSRAAATWEAQGEVASATMGEGVQATAAPPQAWTRSLSMGDSPILAIRAF